MFLHQQGRLHDAITIYNRLLAAQPDNPEALHYSGLITFQLGNRDKGLELVGRSVRRRPDYFDAWVTLGNLFLEAGRPKEAVHVSQRAHTLFPNRPEFLVNLGAALRHLGQLEEARSVCEHAIELAPNSAAAHHNYGVVLRTQGRMEEAISAYRIALKHEPDSVETYDNLALIKTFVPGDPDIRAMKDLLTQKAIGRDQEVKLRFALAKAHDDIGEYEIAFGHLKRGNLLVRSGYEYEIGQDESRADRVIEAFDKLQSRRSKKIGHSSAKPIFIVGMPRSGTSLVEQILASHSQIHGAGEITVLPRLMHELEVSGGTMRFPELAAKLSDSQFEWLGEQYVKRLPPQTKGEHYVTDKLPGNFFRLGIIDLALPNARIIHCVRSPMDTCLSCYQQLFTSYQPFSYNLTELGCFYRLYERLMNYWCLLLPDRILEVRYEDLVSRLEEETGRLLNFLELPIEEACLSFHKTSRPVNTASAAQVRRPIYTSSVEKWRNYSAHLQELKDTLSGGGCPGPGD